MWQSEVYVKRIADLEKSKKILDEYYQEKVVEVEAEMKKYLWEKRKEEEQSMEWKYASIF